MSEARPQNHVCVPTENTRRVHFSGFVKIHLFQRCMDPCKLPADGIAPIGFGKHWATVWDHVNSTSRLPSATFPHVPTSERVRLLLHAGHTPNEIADLESVNLEHLCAIERTRAAEYVEYCRRRQSADSALPLPNSRKRNANDINTEDGEVDENRPAQAASSKMPRSLPTSPPAASAQLAEHPADFSLRSDAGCPPLSAVESRAINGIAPFRVPSVEVVSG